MDVGEFAGHLARDIDAADRLSDHLVVRGLLQLDLRIDVELHALADQRAVADRAVRRGLHAYDAVLHREVGGRNAEALRGALDERAASGGAGPAQLAAALEDRQVRRGQPLVRRARGVAHDHFDLAERNVELVGGELHERGARAGAEIDLADKNRDLVVGRNGEPGVDRFLGDRLRRAQCVGTGGVGEREADSQNAARLQEDAAVERCLMDCHGCLPHAAAARFTAATMRLWVPQRHRLSASAARMSVSLGLLFFSRSAADVMIMPLMQ